MRQLGSRYTLDRVIGRGGTGEVWLARDETGSAVAVKVLRPELVEDEEIVVRFLRERHVLRSVRNRHVVGVHDLVVEGETHAIVMDYVSRSDLRTHLREHGGSLPPADAVALARQMLDALAAVHASGVVHRDVKPENVLIDVDDEGRPLAKLSDFGVSRLLDGVTLTRISGLIGTPRYMAPELGNGADPSPASDLYAVGVVLYELVTGRPPYTGDHPFAVLRAHAEQEPERPREVPQKLWRVVTRLLAKNPSHRYPDARAAGEALAAVEPALAGLPAVAALPTESAPTFTPGRRTTGGRRWRLPLQTPTHLRTAGTHRRRDVLVVGVTLLCFGLLATLAMLVTVGASTGPAELAWLDTYDSFVVRRDWQLTGKHGNVLRATEAIMVTDPVALPGTRYLQVVPKAIAANARQVHFLNRQPVTLQADPVFDVPLAGAQAGSFGYLTYAVAVKADGSKVSRLKAWNEALKRARHDMSVQQPNLQRQLEPNSTKEVTAEPNLVQAATVPASDVVLQAIRSALVRTTDTTAALLGAPGVVIAIGSPVPPQKNVTVPTTGNVPTTVIVDPNPPTVLPPPTLPPTTDTTAAPPASDTSSTPPSSDTSSTPAPSDTSSTPPSSDTSSTPPSSDTSSTPPPSDTTSSTDTTAATVDPGGTSPSTTSDTTPLQLPLP